MASESCTLSADCPSVIPGEDSMVRRGKAKVKRCQSKGDQNLSKVCAVCEDFAKNMHFGAVTCNSCKTFFRRAVQSNSFTNFKCNFQKDCQVFKKDRRLCQYCRFQKCLDSKMEINAVMNQADRISLWRKKLDRYRQNSEPQPHASSNGRKREMNFNTSTLPPICTASSVPRFLDNPDVIALSREEVDIIKHLVSLQHLVFSSICYPQSCYGDRPENLANLFFYICQKLYCFFYRLDDFHEIPKADQLCLLRNGISTSIYIHGAYNYDPAKEEWPSPATNEALKLPNISKDTLRKFTAYPEVYHTLMDFYGSYGNDIKDETIVVILCLISLYYVGDNIKLMNRDLVVHCRNRYISLLNKYLISKLGRSEGKNLLSKLLQSIFDIQKLVSFHEKVDIEPSIEFNSDFLEAVAHFKSQMLSLTEEMKGIWDKGAPHYSSVFSLDEAEKLNVPQRYLELSFNREQSLLDPKPDIYPFKCHHQHHHLTNSIFGDSIQDKLLPIDNIFRHCDVHEDAESDTVPESSEYSPSGNLVNF